MMIASCCQIAKPGQNSLNARIESETRNSNAPIAVIGFVPSAKAAAAPSTTP